MYIIIIGLMLCLGNCMVWLSVCNLSLFLWVLEFITTSSVAFIVTSFISDLLSRVLLSMVYNLICTFPQSYLYFYLILHFRGNKFKNKNVILSATPRI